jgi:hypothetical protein
MQRKGGMLRIARGVIKNPPLAKISREYLALESA